MAYQQLSATADWPATAQFTADGETSIRIVNPYIYGEPVFWVTTADDTAPALFGAAGSRIDWNGFEDVTLEDGERLWLVAPEAAQPVFVTLIY